MEAARLVRLERDTSGYQIRKTLVDQGSSIDVLYWKTFKKMGLDESEIISLDE